MIHRESILFIFTVQCMCIVQTVLSQDVCPSVCHMLVLCLNG